MCTEKNKFDQIINLTKHQPLQAQVNAGVMYRKPFQDKVIIEYLTFDEFPSKKQISLRAFQLALTALLLADKGVKVAAMIDGPPFLMGPLERELKEINITPLYSFGRYETINVTSEEGNTQEICTFHYLGFIEID